MQAKQTRRIVIDPDALLDQTQVAKILSTTTKFLEARRCRGGGPEFVRVGRLIRYHPEALKQWIQSRTMHSTSEEAKNSSEARR